MCQLLGSQWAKPLHHFGRRNYSPILSVTPLSCYLTASLEEEEKNEMESLLLPIILLSAGECFWQTSLPRGEKYPGKFNKNRDCILLTVKVYLSFAVEGSRMHPTRKIMAEELRSSLKLPLINKNSLQEKHILQLRDLNRRFSAGGFCPPGDNVWGHFWLS